METAVGKGGRGTSWRNGCNVGRGVGWRSQRGRRGVARAPRAVAREGDEAGEVSFLLDWKRAGRREAFLRGCLLASAVSLADAGFGPAALMVARADQEPAFQIEVKVPGCGVPQETTAEPAAPAEALEGAEVVEAAAPPPPPARPEVCVKPLGEIQVNETGSGLKYKDLIVGDGEQPPVGYQVVVNYVVMLQDGRVISSTLEGGYPADIRVGSGNVVKGIDEGLLGMRSGGFRRLYVPGELSFQQRLASAPGRPAVPAESPIIVDINLLYVPGLD
ncbi:FKBP-type peptidyl-prolyl cis-trans isomerase [Chloropicon primus]|uniref:peptidylprolyl isomerase n=1 Tax=Chloropicon primus TaxID=1764295 RepID=A0A5B8MK68_9CHLO|nr:FKBP-type peptidyl-prolyl cis-trans isomerase [Chloropicon primus]UPQ98991.1 FKBP-type peptidyl-prolyl cis-trans isomerase [Chloropicon primus]|eukprot:QDZ19780.1 FKBP-type peptidyl-prolyl cis-trans isomerase [Chloropicon primus]